MLTGLEASIAKTAASAASRAASPAKNFLLRTIARRQLRQELQSGVSIPELNAFLQKIEPARAQELLEFAQSPEVKNLAVSLATDTLLNYCGRKDKTISKELKTQLRSLLALQTSLDTADADAAAELIFAALTQAVKSSVAVLAEDEGALSAPAKASMLKVQDSYLDSAVRNSSLLAQISDLAEYKAFEDQYRTQVTNLYGTMRLPHAGTTRRVPYEQLYVQPNVKMLADETPTATLHEPTRLAIGALADSSIRFVLLGDPGGGKSTLSLKLTYDCASGSGIYDTKLPFLIILREYAAEIAKQSMSMAEYLAQLCKTPFAVEPPANALEYALLNGRAFVIFDGLDELLDTALRRQVVDAVSGFAHRYPTTPILVTSRRVGYTDAPLDPDLFNAFSLCEFSPDQVEKYVKNWFELDESLEAARRQDLRKSFIADSQFVADLRVNPLLLSLMCGIYASENYIPRNRPDVYEKCALLLFDSWDKQRGIKSPLSFDAHVQAAMRSLALWLYPQQATKQGLSREKLIRYMTDYLLKKRFDSEQEAENAATEFIDFCKGRAWVLTDVGAELYGFTHRTFLEYFAASQIVRENTDPSKLFDYLVERLSRGGWEVVAQLALQVLNKAVEDGADDFIEILLAYVDSDITLSLKSKLLAFAAQALTYIVPRPPVLQALVGHVIGFYLSTSDAAATSHVDEALSPLNLLLAASPENLPLVSKYLYEALSGRLHSDCSDQCALAVGLYPEVFAVARGKASGSSYGASSDLAFWSRQGAENFGLFSGAIEAQQAAAPWLGIYLLESGHLSGSAFLSRYGPSALFLFEDGSPLMRLVIPLALRVVLANTRPREFRVVPGDGTSMSPAQIEELKEALLDIPMPWFVMRRPDGLRGFLEFALGEMRAVRARRLSTSALLLLIAAATDTTEDHADLVLMTHRAGRLRRDDEMELLTRAVLARLDLRQLLDSGSQLVAGKGEGGGEAFVAPSIAELQEAGVDPRTSAAITRWLTDPNFFFISSEASGRRGRGTGRLRRSTAG